MSQRQLLLRATYSKLPAWHVEKKQEKSQGDRSGRQVKETDQGEGAGDRSGREVREKEQETGQGDRSGRRSRKHVSPLPPVCCTSGPLAFVSLCPTAIAATERVPRFNTTAVIECTSTQQRWQGVLQHNSGDRVYLTQQRWQSVLQHNSGDRVYFNTTAVIECTSTQQWWQSVLQHNSGDT